MKAMFFKSGAYYETPAISVIGTVNDLLDSQVTQFFKTDNAFKLDFVHGEYQLFMATHIPGATFVSKKIDPKIIGKALDNHDFVFYGVVTDQRATITHAEVFNALDYFAVDRKTKKIVNVITGKVIDGKNIMAAMYCVRMTDDIDVCYLTSLARVNSSLVDEEGEHRIVNDILTICVDDGDAIRSQFVDIKFSGVRKHFRNQDLVIGYAVFADKDQDITLDIFRDTTYVTEEFKSCFKIDVDSNFNVVVENHQVVLEAPGKACQGYLSVKLVVDPVYADIADREIKETLSFDFTVHFL